MKNNISVIHTSVFIVFFLIVFVQPSSGQSIDYDKELGEEASVQVQQQIGVVEHETASGYLESIGNRLVSNLGEQPFDYQFNIIDMTSPNAMALPAGYVYFSRGILLLANSEDELAGIMGHEIIHVHKRHSVKAMKRRWFPSILEIPGNIVKNVISPELGELINSPLKLTSDLFHSKYSRGNERESDELGAALAARSGYEPEALADILESLSGYTQLETGEEKGFSFFDSHPYTPDRVSDIKKIASKLTVDKSTKSFAADKKEFLNKLDGMVIGKNPANGIFNDNRFIHPDLEIAITFPATWETMNTPIAVGAYEPNGEAQIFFGIAGPAGSPTEYAEKFLDEYKESITEKPLRNESVNVNGLDAYLISLSDASGRSRTIIHLLWVVVGESTLEFIGLGSERHTQKLKNTVLSLNQATKKEIDDIKVIRLRGESALEGETLSEFSLRTGNVLELPVLSLINSVDQKYVLKEGQLLKIGRSEKYKNN